MPRLSVPVFATKPLKKFTNYIPQHQFRVVLPPVLRNHVATKDSHSQKVSCMDQMSGLMACWKENNYMNTQCQKEIMKFQLCVKQAKDEEIQLAEKAKAGKVKIRGKYNSKVVNQMLQKFPQPPHDINIKR